MKKNPISKKKKPTVEGKEKKLLLYLGLISLIFKKGKKWFETGNVVSTGYCKQTQLHRELPSCGGCQKLFLKCVLGGQSSAKEIRGI